SSCEGGVEVPSGEIVGGEQHTFPFESRVDVASLRKAAQKQGSGHQYDEREPDLHAHERAPKSAAAGRARTGAKRNVRIDASQLQRRRGPAQEAANHAKENREREPEAVDTRLESDRKRADDG